MHPELESLMRADSFQQLPLKRSKETPTLRSLAHPAAPMLPSLDGAGPSTSASSSESTAAPLEDGNDNTPQKVLLS